MATCYTLTDIDVDFILNLPEVIKAKESIDKQMGGSVYFSIDLTPSMRKTLYDNLQLDFSNIDTVPMRWIKGDTRPHIDKGTHTFETTYLAYLTDSPGSLIIGGNSYPIAKGCGYVFSEGLSHETLGTGSEPRLLLGPMSEQGVAVGGVPPTTISANGQTETILFRYSVGNGIDYRINNGSYNGIIFPATIVNTNTDYTLKVLFETDMTIDNNNYYFICGSSNIQFGSESLKTDGSRPVITIAVDNYDGLISNGSETNPGFNNIYIYNLVVDGTGRNTQIGGGWFGMNGFGNGVTHNYIVNCSSSGNLPDGESGSGGILGALSARNAISLYIIGCSSSGTIGSNCGGIVGSSAGWDGNIVIEYCWSTGAIGIGGGGIFGDLAGDSGDAVARYCYSTGTIGANAGGIFGTTARFAQATACYSRGAIAANGGGIFGSIAGYNSGNTPATNCYSVGTFSVIGTGIYGANALDDSPTNCYSANGSWTNSAADAALTELPNPIIGSVWVNRGVNTPYELYNMGYTPYTIENIVFIEGDPALNQSYEITGYQGTTLQAGVISGLSYSILQIDDSIPSNIPSITINSNTGSISTTYETNTGSYTLYIRNNGSYNITRVYLTVNETSNIPICFPAGTLVLTDQGEVAIDKIDITKNTIGGGKQINAITETIPLDSYLICIEKNSFARNVPSRQTIISKDHKIVFRNKLVKAESLIALIPTVYKVQYNKERLYNVLLDNYSIMSVNNLIVETMDPANPLAKIYTSNYTVQEKNHLIKILNQTNKDANNKTTLAKKQILVKKNFKPKEDLLMLVRASLSR